MITKSRDVALIRRVFDPEPLCSPTHYPEKDGNLGFGSHSEFYATLRIEVLCPYDPSTVRFVSVKFLLGTAQLSRSYGIIPKTHREPRESPSQVVEGAVSLGFSAIDTAPVYGNAEEDIGRSRTVLPVFTKLHPELSAEESLSRSRAALQRNLLDGVYLHEEYIGSRRQKDLLKRLSDRKTHEIGAVGVSIYSIEEFRLANVNPDIDLVQLPYNILDQRFNSEFLIKNLDPSKQVFARSIFLQGILLTQASALPPAVHHLRGFKESLENLARDCGLDDLDVALGFAMKNTTLAGVIAGSCSLSELREISSRRAILEGTNLSSVLYYDNLPTWDAVDPRRWRRA